MMSKIVVISTDKNGRRKVETCPRACRLEFKGDNDGEDRISTLPREILVQILSLLTVQEIMSTSVLSRRWRYTWTYVHNLNFDATKILRDLQLSDGDRDPEWEANNYVNMVTHVLSSNQAPSVDLLRIRFDLGVGRCEYDDHVVKWIAFAIKKRVKKLEIDLSSVESFALYETNPFRGSGFESLVELRLAWLNITGKLLENILIGCPLLERLSVNGSTSLVNLKVTGPSLQLKYLEIYECPCVQKIEINAEYLRTLKHDGIFTYLALNNTPRLVELYFVGYFCKIFNDNIPQFSSHLLQLETLGLDMFHMKTITDIRHFPVLCNLKQLELKLRADSYGSLFGLISLLKALPLLQKFSLWLFPWPHGLEREVKKVEKFRFNHLKVVEFHGFIGRAIDLKFANYFIENAVALEKIIIYSGNAWFPESAWNLKETKMKLSARKKAKLLGKRLPPGVTMVIH